MEIENKTAATITPVERIETPMWDRIAIREAVINAIVHNDYSFEVPPKFEIFPDRLEITSAGRLPETMSMQEFFDGVSMPRNKELMRIFKDVELVESLGSGIPRILRAYGTDCFRFTENFIRLTLPISHPHSGDRIETCVTPQNNDIDSIVEKLGKKLGEKLGKKLGNTRIRIIQLIVSNPNITYTEISKTLSVSSTTVEKRIAEMSGVIIQHVGPKKGGHWEIIMP